MTNIKEKLIEILGSLQDYGIKRTPGLALPSLPCNEIIADHLIANGVTVQEGKPLEAFLHPIDAYKGLKAKYIVFKADTGEMVDNCFILRPDKDAAAVEALRAYANATDNKTLAEDIYSWVGKGEPVQEWIPASEPPKDTYEYWIAYKTGGDYFYSTGYFDGKCWRSAITHKQIPVTHWAYLPQPPKEDAQ